MLCTMLQKHIRIYNMKTALQHIEKILFFVQDSTKQHLVEDIKVIQLDVIDEVIKQMTDKDGNSQCCGIEYCDHIAAFHKIRNKIESQ